MINNKLFYLIIIFQFCFSTLLARDYLIMQSTTSIKNSGLIDEIELAFEKKFSIDLRVTSVGTGQAIVNSRNGDGDLMLVHSEEDEIKFIEEGYADERFKVMYNDFVIVGPKHDPSGLKDALNINEALQKLKLGKAIFLSRDDNSGTHKKELSLWHLAEIDITKNDKWYLKNGLGMGITLNMASEIGAYTISDRASWLSFNNKYYLDILFEKDKALNNTYSIIPLSPKKFPHVEYKNSMAFINWLLSDEGKSIINGFKLYDKQLFFTY